jgi:hypothetical protein
LLRVLLLCVLRRLLLWVAAVGRLMLRVLVLLRLLLLLSVGGAFIEDGLAA